MQQFTTSKPIQAMVRIYRDVVSYLIRVCMEHWEEIAQIKMLQARQMYVNRDTC